MLFRNDATESDHRYFQNLSKTELRPDVTAWCNETYERSQSLLDNDFPVQFRLQTPQRISELFFAAAFLDAGWKPIDRVPGFDLAFELGGGRLLVEITTPAPHSSDTWKEEERDGLTLISTDAKTEDAALLRLTSGFAGKAEAIRKLCDDGKISEADYVVIGLSGLRLRQEAPYAPEIGGPVPEFAKAFLPVGLRYVTVQIGDGPDMPLKGGFSFKSTIDQDGKTPVDRNFFLRSDFQHIHAVAYTPLHFGEPITPIKDCAALHNPMASPREPLVKLGLGCEYTVEIRENEFSLRPR